MRRHVMSTMQKRNRLQTAMKLTSTANEAGFDAQRNRLRFFATSYGYCKHFIYAFNERTLFQRHSIKKFKVSPCPAPFP